MSANRNVASTVVVGGHRDVPGPGGRRAPVLPPSAAEAAVVVEAEGPVEVDLHLRAVGLRDDDLVAVARDVGGDVAGLAAADRLHRGRLGPGGVGAGDRLLERLVRGGAVRGVART